jgi:hypothetical protein
MDHEQLVRKRFDECFGVRQSVPIKESTDISKLFRDVRSFWQNE